MYNNSNGTVEHGDANPNQQETVPQTELAENKNVADETDKQIESEGKEEKVDAQENKEAEESTHDSPASEVNESATLIEENSEKDNAIVIETLDENETDLINDTKITEDDDGQDEGGKAPTENASDGEPKGDEEEEEVPDEDIVQEEILVAETEESVSKAESLRKETVEVDLELCRVCMGTEDLSDIFQLEGSVRISDIIMKVCTNIRITARDHLPHKICERCLEQVRIVNEFKIRCEASDKELRKNLKRSTNKSRRQVIVVNCPMSESENDDEPIDDDEYQVSQSEVESEPATSDDSFSPPNKRKRTPKKRGRKPAQYKPPGRRGRPGRKPKHMGFDAPSVLTPTVKRGPGRPPKNLKTSSLSNIVYIEAPDESSSSGEEVEKKKRRRRRGDNPCPKCDEVFPSQLALKQHLKSHPEDIYNCDRCPLWFKTPQALSNHIQRHLKADRLREEKRRERERRQDQRAREPVRSSDQEEKKAAQFGVSAEKKKKLDTAPTSSGRDLFKCVAPLTSTYWSDSFSD